MSEAKTKFRSTINVAVFVVLLALAGYGIASHLSVTLTPSLKHRVFFITYQLERERIAKGDYVMFTLKREVIGQLAGTTGTNKTIKVVACAGGSVLEVVRKDYYCGQEYLGRAKDVSLKGRPVKNFVFNGIIPQGSLFVMGQHKDSFDSRYFGFVASSDVIALAYPIF